MYYNYEWIGDNICIKDSHVMNFEPISGNNAFIISHHVRDKLKIERGVKSLLENGFRYFNIFGEFSDLWAKAISIGSKTSNKIKIEASKIEMSRMVYDLAMMKVLKPDLINYVISDDEYFTEYLVEDLEKIISGKSTFTPYDWKEFKEGLEFSYNKKDAIISVSKDIVIGFLGDEKTFDTINDAFYYKIFDGKSLYEIWNEI